jgi:ABC-2 type transport system ATP-binding protein
MRLDQLKSIYQLEQLSHQLAGSLSGGQKQRLALACAVMHQPKLLFLDEPTSSVDPETRRDFWEQLFDLCDQGITILVSTHYMDEAERCHKLAILENGAKRADDTPQNLMANMPVNVVEIAAANIRQLKAQLIEYPQVVSASQLGSYLRVSVDKSIVDPIGFLKDANPLTDSTHMTLVRASLEDVFVLSTGKRQCKAERVNL